MLRGISFALTASQLWAALALGFAVEAASEALHVIALVTPPLAFVLGRSLAKVAADFANALPGPARRQLPAARLIRQWNSFALHCDDSSKLDRLLDT